MKILTVVGARPQFIKTAVISKELRKQNREILVHTGQHYDASMSDIFLKSWRFPDLTIILELMVVVMQK